MLAYLEEVEAEHGERWPRAVWWSAVGLAVLLGAYLIALWLGDAIRWAVSQATPGASVS